MATPPCVCPARRGDAVLADREEGSTEAKTDETSAPSECEPTAAVPPYDPMTPAAHPVPPKRGRRLMISLRTMMILVLAFGAWLDWFVRRVQVQKDAVAAIKNAGGTVVYDLEWRNGGSNPYGNSWFPEWLGGDQVWMPQWMTRGAGLDYFGNVVDVSLIPTRANDPQAANDATLALVGQLGRLQGLRLNSTAITDAGLAHLAGLNELRDLQIGYTKIGDKGLAHIKGLTGLRGLYIMNTQIGDAGLAHLHGLTSLGLLFAANTRVTDDGVLALEAELPGLQVYREEDMSLFAAQPRANKDLDFARSQPVRLASMLLSHRADAMASRGDSAELTATIDAVCHLEASDKVGLLKVAIACAACIRSLDRYRGHGLSETDCPALQKRCADRGIAALAAAIALGLDENNLVDDGSLRSHHYHVRAGQLEPLSRYPGFRELLHSPTAKSPEGSVEDQVH
jgi:hypothetical protein